MSTAEFEVIANEIEPRLRPHKEVLHRVKLDSSPNIAQQVIHAGEVCAGEEAAGKSILVKTNALGAEPGHKLRSRSLAQWRSKHRVKVVENGTERQEALRKIAFGPPPDFAAYAKMLQEKKIAAEASENASSHRLREKLAGRCNIERRWRRNGTDSKRGVKLLCAGDSAHQEEHAEECDKT